jgi:hypothetical protein
MPFCAGAFSSSCLTPSASAEERAQNSRRACRLRSRQEGDDAVGELAKGLRRMLEIQCAVPEIY